LFCNVPARRRFLKAAHAERARIQQLVAELALARLDVDFTLVSDDKELLRLPRGVTLAERVQQCFGRELGRGLLSVTREFDGLRVEGVVGEPDLARRDGKLELTYVNGRLASEKSALHAVRQAYREFLMGGRFPVYVLQMVLPPSQVDVNIHPRKAEVRFVESRKVAGCLHETVRSALQARTMSMGEQHGGQGSVREGGVQIRPDMPRARSGFPSGSPSLFDGRATAAFGASRAPAEAAGALSEPAIVREPSRFTQAPGTERPNPFRRAAGRWNSQSPPRCPQPPCRPGRHR